MREPHFADDLVSLYLGDCLDVMAALETASVDAVVTDPPYGLEFMGKEWDSFKQAPRRVVGTGGSEAPFAHHAVELSPKRNRAFQEWCEQWAAECFRVLKPGGHVLAFGGTRTYHRLACGIEDAGFEVRDSLHWIYGSGFPKSLDVSKAIDKAVGAQREVTGRRLRPDGSDRNPAIGGAAGSALAGSVDGILNTNGSMALITAPATADAARWTGFGTALKPAHEPIVVARKPLAGTVAANVLAHGTGALNVDGCRVGTTDNLNGGAYARNGSERHDGAENWRFKAGGAGEYEEPAGRWPPNILLTHSADCNGECAPGCPVAEMDAQSGHLVGCGGPKRTDSGDTSIFGIGQPGRTYERDGGGAARFFPCFRYQAKAPKSERPRLPDGTTWPTVKPLELMRWLVRLVTPPGGTVLDPFAGTGTTGQAAALEGFPSLLIERDPVAAELAVRRLSKPVSQTLFG